ncbi:MAG: RnfABCDGE type electron transport complex subunit D, partial [Buchnera aphidicola]|nr:RnfABCDGE type electron transport complex subunit D [Buchnera aphidicola]
IACIPGIFAKCYFFGPSILIQILFSVFVAIFLEIIVLKIRGKNIKKAIFDNSAIVTAVLFSVSLPCFIPGWIIFFGLFFSIVISKHLYGGIGQNIFNPAMVGYAVLLISFPIYLNQWMEVNHFNHII